jgi:hypothetical protein
MQQSELSEKNYKRIYWVNWLICLPILGLFAWPYYEFGRILMIPEMLILPGALLFALSFMLTILHGYVTMSLGNLHRNHYYKWLLSHRLTYGFLFHPMLTRTRFRLSLIIISMLVLFLGNFIP